MKHFITLLFLCLLLPFALEAKVQDVVPNAFYGKNINFVGYKDAKIALKMWTDRISTKFGVTSSIVFYSDFHKLEVDNKKGKVGALMLSPTSYLKHLDYCKSHFTRGWTLVEADGKPFFQYYLLVRKDFSNKKKVLKINYYRYAQAAKMLGQTYIWKHNLQATFQKTTKMSRPILELFFKKCDIAIVKKESWDVMKELNPQLQHSIKILYKSGRNYAELITLFSNKLSKKNGDIYLKVLNNINSSPSGKQLMNLFKFQGVTSIKMKDLAPMERDYEEYLRLKKEHSK